MFGAPLRTFVLADTGSYLSPIICNEELMPRLDVHVCVGSPIFLRGVSNVVYSHTPLYHYKPAYPQHKAWYEFLRGTGYLIWPAGWQPYISLRPINRCDSCLFYPRSVSNKLLDIRWTRVSRPAQYWFYRCLPTSLFLDKQIREHLSFAQTVWSLHPGSKFQITPLSAQWPLRILYLRTPANWGVSMT